jgi:hypothetical protein
MAKRNWSNEFVKYTLTDKQIENMKDMLDEVKDPFNLLVDLIYDGYRVTIKHLVERSAANVIVIPIDENSDNDGLMLSAFHAEPIKALFEVWYIHFIVSERDWSSTNQKRSLYW